MAVSICIAVTTFPAGFDTEMLFADLLQAGLAACIQTHPVTSRYQWQGKTCHDDELRVLIKTTRSRVAALQAAVHKAHPYDLPQWIVQDAEASAEYGDWVQVAAQT